MNSYMPVHLHNMAYLIYYNRKSLICYCKWLSDRLPYAYLFSSFLITSLGCADLLRSEFRSLAWLHTRIASSWASWISMSRLGSRPCVFLIVSQRLDYDESYNVTLMCLCTYIIYYLTYYIICVTCMISNFSSFYIAP